MRNISETLWSDQAAGGSDDGENVAAAGRGRADDEALAVAVPVSGHRGRCAIAGIGHTAFSKDPGVSSLTLALPVCRDAIAHAGGVRFVTDLPGRQELAVGRPMVVRFDEVGDGITRPRWQPA